MNQQLVVIYWLLYFRYLQYGVLARPEAMNQTQLALEVGIKTLELYEDFFGINFPLPKQGIDII